MEVDNLFTGAYQHKQTSNFCFSFDLRLFRRAGLVQAVESYCLRPEGPEFESRSPRIAARVRLAANTLPQTPHSAGALCIGYALFDLRLFE